MSISLSRKDVIWGYFAQFFSIASGIITLPLILQMLSAEEIGMLRTLPDMIVCAPGNPVETRAVTTFTAHHEGPCYIRIGKAGEPVVHTNASLELSCGEILEIRKGEITAIFSTGAMLKYVYDFVSKNNIKASVYSFPFIKPIDKDGLLAVLNLHTRIITIEEHQSQGGFGSAILEVINDLIEEGKLSTPPYVRRIAIQDKFYSVAGSQEYLRKLAGLELKKEFFST